MVTTVKAMIVDLADGGANGSFGRGRTVDDDGDDGDGDNDGDADDDDHADDDSNRDDDGDDEDNTDDGTYGEDIAKTKILLMVAAGIMFVKMIGEKTETRQRIRRAKRNNT